MDVILLKDVEKLGAEGAVVHVKPGYARNFLMPSGLAVPATPEQMKTLETLKKQRERKAKVAQGQAETLKRQIDGKSLTLKLEVGEGDKPFGSITSHDIADALSASGTAVEKHAVQLEQPIKTLGVYDIPIRVHAQVFATVKLWVVKA
jgi:large subunit ribosomal protein L9